MVSDHLCAISWRARPGSFVSLMTLYESNYVRLGWLLHELDSIDGTHVSRVPGDVGLHLRVGERSRFTSTLELTYVLEDDVGPVVTPDMQIRVYRDARLAEAQSCSGWRRHALLRHFRQPERQVRNPRRDLGRRWARNVLLNKWLEYCAERGHRFDATTRCMPDSGDAAARIGSQPTHHR
jgi:uncharacterized protein YqiB (DUF1249 family)